MLRSLLVLLFPAILISACAQKESNDDTTTALLLLALTTSPATASGVQTNCPTTTANSHQITNSITYAIRQGDLCFMYFRAGSNANFTVTKTSDSGDTDLAVSSVGATAAYGSKPTTFWPNGACGAFSWNTCVASTASPESVNNIPMTTNQEIGIGVYGYSCSSTNACRFTINAN